KVLLPDNILRQNTAHWHKTGHFVQQYPGTAADDYFYRHRPHTPALLIYPRVPRKALSPDAVFLIGLSYIAPLSLVLFYKPPVLLFSANQILPYRYSMSLPNP